MIVTAVFEVIVRLVVLRRGQIVGVVVDNFVRVDAQLLVDKRLVTCRNHVADKHDHQQYCKKRGQHAPQRAIEQFVALTACRNGFVHVALDKQHHYAKHDTAHADNVGNKQQRLPPIVKKRCMRIGCVRHRFQYDVGKHDCRSQIEHDYRQCSRQSLVVFLFHTYLHSFGETRRKLMTNFNENDYTLPTKICNR